MIFLSYRNHQLRKLGENKGFIIIKLDKLAQIINPFLNSKTSVNHDKVDGLPANLKSLQRGLKL